MKMLITQNIRILTSIEFSSTTVVSSSIKILITHKCSMYTTYTFSNNVVFRSNSPNFFFVIFQNDVFRDK